MTQDTPLPDGWTWTTVGDIVTFEYGKGLIRAKRDPSGKIPVYGSNGIVGYHSISLVDKPCLIVGRKGAAGAVHKSNIPCWPIDTTYYVIPPENINLSFLYYLFSSLELVSLDRSTAIPGLNRNDAYAVKIPLPPLPEQERIVAKIEALFTQLEAGTTALRRVQAGLKRYKTSVLKAACEGRLVAQDPSDESVEELLRRLGKSPLVGDAFPPLPEGWCWTKMNDVTRKITDGTHFTPTYMADGIAFISVKDIYSGKIHFDKCKYITQDEHNQLIKRCYPEPLDVLITKSGTIGRIAVVKTDRPFSLFVSVALIKQLREVWDSDYLAIALENYINHLDIQQDVKGGVIKNLHVEDIKEIMLPLPPLAEQRRIVAEVERRLSVAQEIGSVVTGCLERASRLRQAILKQAFEGRLVAQNPEDEPAETPLETIIKEEKKKVDEVYQQARLF
jgi:type I restriction enzyme S subunit